MKKGRSPAKWRRVLFAAAAVAAVLGFVGAVVDGLVTPSIPSPNLVTVLAVHPVSRFGGDDLEYRM